MMFKWLNGGHKVGGRDVAKYEGKRILFSQQIPTKLIGIVAPERQKICSQKYNECEP
jgi:hypothetical protein